MAGYDTSSIGWPALSAHSNRVDVRPVEAPATYVVFQAWTWATSSENTINIIHGTSDWKTRVSIAPGPACRGASASSTQYREAEALEAALEQAAEQMEAVGGILEAWQSLPRDVQLEIQRRALQIWQLRGAYRVQFLAALRGVFAQNPAGWQQALLRNRAATVQQLAVLAGQMARLPARNATTPPGFSDAQVRQYRRRQQARGYVPGRSRQTGRSRELEFEIDRASLELEAAEQFFTKVTPIPGLGNKEGHEILTRTAMRGLPLSSGERSAVELGVIRPDRGGRSYWNFPRSALESLKAAAQPSHSLRPTPSSTVRTALGLIRARFARLHGSALRAATRSSALEWLGEALHLLQDSFSSAHVERAGGTGPIRNIRAFFIRLGWPPLSRAPGEHNAPSDPRDDVFVGGAMRPEARAAVSASRAFLVMALRHLRAPGSPTNVAELRAFIRRYLCVRLVIIDFHRHAGRGDLLTEPWNTGGAHEGVSAARATRRDRPHGRVSRLPHGLCPREPRTGPHRRALAPATDRLRNGERKERRGSRARDGSRRDHAIWVSWPEDPRAGGGCRPARSARQPESSTCR